MKKINCYIIWTALVSTVFVSSCQKEDPLNVDMSIYNVDSFVETELDEWIGQHLTDPYNIQLVYRFERNLTDVGKDIAPIELEKVRPSGEAIINIFLKTYEKVAGPTFIKTYTPKQFVLYGSNSYNSNGSVTLGTADGGRRVVLYGMNLIDFGSAELVARKMRTIHHEFTHIINQNIAIPPEFEQVTKADYNSDWTASANTAELAQSMGFVSRYARSIYTEDFAEMAAHLLVEGQLWFNAYARAAGEDAEGKLKRKETLVVDYFKQYYDIDFRELQYEVSKVLQEQYHDPRHTFLYGIQNELILSPLLIDFETGLHYVEYGKSEKFDAVWQEMITALAAVSNNAGRQPKQFQFAFDTPGRMQLQASYQNAAGSNFSAWYDFDMSASETGEITFTFVDDGVDATSYNNGRVVRAGYQPLIDYLENHTFIASWMAEEAGPSYYQDFAGFYVKDDPSNYFYGNF